MRRTCVRAIFVVQESSVALEACPLGAEFFYGFPFHEAFVVGRMIRQLVSLRLSSFTLSLHTTIGSPSYVPLLLAGSVRRCCSPFDIPALLSLLYISGFNPAPPPLLRPVFVSLRRVCCVRLIGHVL